MKHNDIRRPTHRSYPLLVCAWTLLIVATTGVAGQEPLGARPETPLSAAPARPKPAEAAGLPLITPPDEHLFLLEEDPSGVPRWVTPARAGRYTPLIPPGGGYVGVGTASSEAEATARAAVDFAAAVSTTVTTTVNERSGSVAGATFDDYEIASEVRSQAVLTGMRPWVYAGTDGTWVAMYRIRADEYRDLVTAWMENVALMGEATRKAEMERLKQERFALEAQAEAELTAIRAAELEEQRRREERRSAALLEEPFLKGPFTPQVMSIDTAALPGKPIHAAVASRFDQEGNVALRTSAGVRLFNVFSVEAFSGGFRQAGEPIEHIDIPVVGVGAKVRLLNNAGLLHTYSLAVGARVMEDAATPEELSIASEAAMYVAGHVRVPRPLHGTYFVYGGSDRIAVGARWAPFWRAMEDAVSAAVAVDIDTGFRSFATGRRASVETLIGLEFRPGEASRIGVFSESFARYGVHFSMGM